MKVYVLGPNGMLGKYVSKFLGQYYDVIELNRRHIDASKITQEKLTATLHHLGVRKGDVLINCMGTIKPRVDELGELNAIQVNSVFPRILANSAEHFEAYLIHPTTDCVYSGLKGSYSENDKYDISDIYGMSKAMGEPKNCTVIRTSIIGEENGQGRSLIEWIKSSAGTTVNGFTNHYWNGITCLQFAKICKIMIDNEIFWEGTRHIFSNTLNKAELVNTVSLIYNLNITVNPMETIIKCDRTLDTANTPIFEIPNLAEQIVDMKEFSKTLYEKELA